MYIAFFLVYIKCINGLINKVKIISFVRGIPNVSFKKSWFITHKKNKSINLPICFSHFECNCLTIEFDFCKRFTVLKSIIPSLMFFYLLVKDKNRAKQAHH